jgi:hypothetical protein
VAPAKRTVKDLEVKVVRRCHRDEDDIHIACFQTNKLPKPYSTCLHILLSMIALSLSA